jgi:hypothetical protein
VITPGLLRRSFARATQWRLILIAPLVLLLPTLATLVPLLRFLGEQLDHSPRWQKLIPWLDSQALCGLVREYGAAQAGSGIVSGLIASCVTVLFLSPLVAGAALAAARSDEEELALRPLLVGAAEHYGRLLRMQVAAVIPLGLAGAAWVGAAALATKAVQKAVTESHATMLERSAMAGGATAVFLAHLTVDAGRAWFAAQPARRSAFFALGAGVRLVARRPLRSLSIGLSGGLLGVGLAASIMVLRQQLPQASAAMVALAFVLAQLAVASVGWGHAARLIGLTELARADAADRARQTGFEMAPPKTSPPPITGGSLPAVFPPVEVSPAAEAAPAQEASPGPDGAVR